MLQWVRERLDRLQRLEQDQRWLAHDHTSMGLTTRYLNAISTDWRSKVHDHSSVVRSRLGLNPEISLSNQRVTITTKPKLILLGYGEHGKGTCVKLLNTIFGLTGISSSYFANEHVVYPVLKDLYGYTSFDECYYDRHNHRQEWYDLIKQYNTPDGCRLARDLYAQYNIYDGVRNIEEFISIKEAGLFDYAIWVDASQRKPIEDASSCTVSSKDADIVLDNNGPLYITTRKLIKLITTLYPSMVNGPGSLDSETYAFIPVSRD